MPIKAALLLHLLACIMACNGNGHSGNLADHGEGENVEKTFRYNKGPVFTEEERKILDKAKKVVTDKNIDVSGLDERIIRDGQSWFVWYVPAGHDSFGGGWEVRFTYPSGEFVGVYRSQ